tara:strand:- start:6001 stop:6660 length:660 start_codon:yes stop_codon:yes gene_type:complete
MKRIAFLIALALTLWFGLAWLSNSVGLADDTNTQTNTSGSNTNITGGYESTSTTTYESGSESTSTTTSTTNSTTNNKNKTPPPTANAPSFSSLSQDVCSMGVSGALSTGIFSTSVGKHFRDLNCERIKLAKVLQDFGMKVASVAVLCQDERVFQAMEMAGTPCPFEGKIGKEAKDLWKKYETLRPDYKLYTERQKVKKEVDRKDGKITITDISSNKSNK